MNASRDENSVPTLLGTLNTNGLTPTRVLADPGNHGLQVEISSSGSDNGGTTANRDENNIPVLLAVSSADGITPVAVYADSNGNLLIDNS